MKNKKEFPFTKLQLLWLDRLEKYPERQMTNQLGVLTEEDTGKGPMKYRACCLGEAAICMVMVNKKSPRILLDKSNGRELHEQPNANGSSTALTHTYQKLNLRDNTGAFKKKYLSYGCLMSMNDSTKMSWTDIAKYIRENPENVFTNLDKSK